MAQNSNLLASGPSTFRDTKPGIGFQGGARFRLGSELSEMGQVGIGDIPLLFARVSLRY